MDRKEIFYKLSEPLPEEGVERTKSTETRKGYNTTNWGYQFYVNRLNEALEDSWTFTWSALKAVEGAYKSGQPFIEITVSVTISLFLDRPGRTCVGSHTSTNYGDALKGAITNGFKKTAAFWGIGWQAYAGQIDDDTFLPDLDKNKVIKPKGDFSKARERIAAINNKAEGSQVLAQLENRAWEPEEYDTLISELSLKCRSCD